MTFSQALLTIGLPFFLFCILAYVTEFAWDVRDHNTAVDAANRGAERAKLEPGTKALFPAAPIHEAWTDPRPMYREPTLPWQHDDWKGR
jgi:hypothetical protein